MPHGARPQVTTPLVSPQLSHSRMHGLGTYPGQVLQAPKVRRLEGPQQGSWERGWAAGVWSSFAARDPLWV